MQLYGTNAVYCSYIFTTDLRQPQVVGSGAKICICGHGCQFIVTTDELSSSVGTLYLANRCSTLEMGDKVLVFNVDIHFPVAVKAASTHRPVWLYLHHLLVLPSSPHIRSRTVAAQGSVDHVNGNPLG